MKRYRLEAGFIHCRSSYSLLNGVLSPRRILRRAAACGARVAGLTDINNLYGLPEFLEASSEAGLLPMAGSVITDPSAGAGQRYLCTVYCTGRRGFGRLNRIITGIKEASVQAEPAAHYDPVGDILDGGREELIIISSRPDVLERLRAGGSEGLYAGLYLGLPYDRLLRHAGRLGIPSAALCETVYFNDEDLRRLRLLRAVERRTPLSRIEPGADPDSACGDAAAAAAAAAAAVWDEAAADGGGPGGELPGRFFSAVPAALRAASEIAEAAAGAEIFPGGWVFPRYDGLGTAASGEMLYSLCRQGIERRYGPRLVAERGSGELRARIEARLSYEMKIICSKGFASYFLVVRDIVMQAPRTCGRGSAASSIVSYLLGITHVDPLEFNLFFERFLNMERQDPPDIDIDFPWDERGKAIAYVLKKYSGSSAMVADHVCFRRRGAAREAAKALGMTDTQTDLLMKKWRSGRGEALPPDVAGAAALLYGQPRYIGDASRRDGHNPGAPSPIIPTSSLRPPAFR